MPSNQARTRIGVGESVNLTFSGSGAAWSMSPNAGVFSQISGTSVLYYAPDRANSVTITATGGGCSASITFEIVEPSGVRMERRAGTLGNHTKHKPSAGFIADVYILPADVSFENCSYLESDCSAVGRGCAEEYLRTNPSSHDPNTEPIAIGPPVSDTSGSKVDGYDQIASFAGNSCDGGWTFAIPWSFQVGSGAAKQFATVNQTFDMTASGSATVTKAGASNQSGYNDDTEVDPLFGT
jgi:hypothetical protein